METRKKYKIVLSEKYVRKSKNGKEWFQFPVNISGQLVAIQTIIPLDPYTEPDTEQVRKEAYEQGRKVGIKDGMCEAWETAKKVTYVSKYGGYGDCLDKVFDRHDGDAWDVFDYSPTEAIEKIRQYEKEREEQITKGDIVLIKSTPEVEILVTYADEEYVSGIALTEVDGNCEIGDQYTNIRISNVENTGRHYDIVSVLQKMRES